MPHFYVNDSHTIFHLVELFLSLSLFLSSSLPLFLSSLSLCFSFSLSFDKKKGKKKEFFSLIVQPCSNDIQ